MNLSKMNCSRGAPMGRREHHAYGSTGIIFELEWVPMVDGDYDAGGAYFGGGTPLYHAVGTLDGEEVVSCFLRAADRESAVEDLLGDYPGCTVLPENGSLIKQAIAFLEDYKAGLPVEDEQLAEEAGDEIDDLKEILELRGLT